MEESAKDIVLERLNKSDLFKLLKEKCESENAGESVTQVVELVEYAYSRTKTIIKYMNEYTLHDEIHLFRVLSLMKKLLGEDNLKKLSSPEIILLILSAFYHDIGMAPLEQKVKTWKAIWDSDFETKYGTLSEEAINELELPQFVKFLKPYVQEIKNIETFQKEQKTSESENIKAHLISEYIRKTHADRARTIIDEKASGFLKYKAYDLALPLANVCYSHNENAYDLLDFPRQETASAGIYLSIPLVALLLRLADILDFDGNRTPEVLFSHLQIKNPISLSEWQKHRSIDAWEISDRSIMFSAKCEHPAIELSIRKFCDQIDKELESANNIIGRLEEYEQFFERGIRLRVPLKLKRDNIQAKRNIRNEPLYEYCETKFELNKKQVIKLLMGTELYSNPEEAIRELLQNSIDTCRLRKILQAEWNIPYEPKISINYLKEDDDYYIQVEDNGRGMDKEIIDKYFSRIGQSFYKSNDFYSILNDEAQFQPISRFGIGILSCFMISNQIEVHTKMVMGNYESSEPLLVKIEGEDSVFWLKKGSRVSPGTSIKLKLKSESNPWKNNTDLFIKTLDKILINPEIPITVNSFDKQQEYVEIDFDSYDWKELKPEKWEENEFTSHYEIKYDNFNEDGFRGKALIAVLENNNQPFLKNELEKVPVEVKSKSFELSRNIVASGSSNSFKSNSITYDGKGEIIDKEDIIYTNRSKSRLSLHGIEVDHTLHGYPQPYLQWPMPMLIIIDVGGCRDLDLNAARTKIRSTNKWEEFEKALADKTLSKLKEQMEPTFFKSYLDTISSVYFNSSIFQSVLNEYKKSST